MNWASIGLEQVWPAGVKPKENLPLDRQSQTQFGQESFKPTAGGKNQPFRQIVHLVRRDLDAAAIGFPTQHLLRKVQRRSLFPRAGKVRGDAFFREENACARFPHARHVFRRVQCRKAARDFLRGQHFVRQSVCFRAASRAGDYYAVGSANHQAARLHEQPLACFSA